jgi:hypothetical protein
MNRTNRILAAVLALQIVLAVVIFWPRPAGSVAGGENLFAGLEADQIVQLTISDAMDRHIQLVKKLDAWVLPEADDYPALESRVSELVASIVELKADRLVAQTAASHKQLKVADDDFERRIAFELADGTAHTLYLGASPSYQVSHARADDRNEVYLVSGLLASGSGAQASNWVDTLYFSAPSDQIAALTLENANGKFEFEKDEAGVWTMNGLAAEETLNEDNVKSLASRAASVRLIQPLGKIEKEDYGLQSPNAVLTVLTRDEAGNTETFTLRVGAQDEADKSYAVGSSASLYYVSVADYTATAFTEKTRDDFITPPPTPEPTPEPEAEPTPTP